jgi:hypothetical protein
MISELGGQVIRRNGIDSFFVRDEIQESAHFDFSLATIPGSS